MRQAPSAAIALSIFLVVVGSVAPLAADEGRADSTGWLGVSIDRSAEGDGAFVSRVFRDSPALDAGVRAQDRITALDGEPISSGTDLVRRIAERGPGGWISLSVTRGEDALLLDARLERRPAVIDSSAVLQGWLGVAAIDLPPTLRQHFGAPESAGVMIAEVESGSPAEAAGFRPGDVAFEMDGTPLESVGELVTRVQGTGVGNAATFTVARDGAILVLEPRVAAAPTEPEDPRR